MKIFIDTAKLGEIKEACSWGIVDGVTTNPSLIRKAVDVLKAKSENVEMEAYIKQICETVGEGKPVSLEVISLTRAKMIEEAEILYHRFNEVAGNVVIKIPINTYNGEDTTSDYDGLKVISELSRKDIPVNATLVMSSEQALLAAKAGAKYASPFAGRIDDYIRKNLGMKFEKQDYFDSCLMEIIGEQRFYGRIEDTSDESPQSVYFDQKIKEFSNFAKDKGIDSGVDLIRSIMRIYRNYNMKTEIIAASIRNARQVREMAEAEADIATIPFNIIKEMIGHPKTVEGIKSFVADVVPEYSALFE